MESLIQIKCPWCSAVLSVKNQPGLERAMLTCPVCGRKQPFAAYKKVDLKSLQGLKNQSASDGETQLPGMPEKPVQTPENHSDNLPMTIGVLRHLPSMTKYELVMGNNVIGRKANSSKATIQLETGEGHRLSREHVIVEVKNVPQRGIVHYISLYKEKVNPTKIGDLDLAYGDKVKLNHGDVINLPDVSLRFEIPDEDSTELIYSTK